MIEDLDEEGLNFCRGRGFRWAREERRPREERREIRTEVGDGEEGVQVWWTKGHVGRRRESWGGAFKQRSQGMGFL